MPALNGSVIRMSQNKGALGAGAAVFRRAATCNVRSAAMEVRRSDGDNHAV
jgi:hypothetical protein